MGKERKGKKEKGEIKNERWRKSGKEARRKEKKEDGENR